MEKIDAVITWVDGSDPKYQLKHKGFLKKRDRLTRLIFVSYQS